MAVVMSAAATSLLCTFALAAQRMQRVLANRKNKMLRFPKKLALPTETYSSIVCLQLYIITTAYLRRLALERLIDRLAVLPDVALLAHIEHRATLQLQSAHAMRTAA